MTQHPSLPVEISDAIIDVLSGDWRSLAACALASSVLRPRANYHLCKDITLNVDSHGNSDIHDFIRTFAPGSLLVELPISLHICGGENFGSLPDVLQLGHLRNTRILRLSSVRVTVPRLRSLYMPLPRLEEFHIYRLRRVSPEAVEIPYFDAHASKPQHLYKHHSPLPWASRLRAVTMCFHTLDQASGHICQAVGEDVDFVRSPPVSLSFFSYHLPWKHTLSSWTQVLSNSANTLGEVRISLRNPLSEADEAGLFSALSKCSRIRAMTLCIVFQAARCKILPACIASLAVWFHSAGGPLPAFARVLEDIRVHITGPVQYLYLRDSGSEALAHLALALLPDAYPALAAFRAVHHRWTSIPPEDSSSALSEEEAVGSIAQALTPLREAGIRVDVETTLSSSEMTHAYGGPASAFF